MRLRTRILAWLLLPMLLSPGSASATIFTWNVAAGGLTNTSVNWSPSGVPGANDDTRYWQSGVTYTITSASPGDTCNTVWASSTGHPQFSCSDPLRVHNAFQVDGGVTATILAGTVHAGWFTVGPGTLTITGNGTQAISTNNSATNYFGNSSGFTSTVNVNGGATFTGRNVQVPELNGATGILNVAGHPTTGMASSFQTETFWVGRQGVGDVELSAGANIQAPLLYLGSDGYGKMHVFRGFGVFSGQASLNVVELHIGDNELIGSPAGTGVLAVDQGTVQTTASVFMGDDDGGGPDTLRMNGGYMTIGDRLFENANNSSVLDLHGGTLFINDNYVDFQTGSTFNQAVPLSIDGAGGGPTLTLFGDALSNLKTATPLSLIVGRSGGGTLNVTGHGLAYGYFEDLEVAGNAAVADMSTGTGVINADALGAFGVAGTLTVGPGRGLVQARHGSAIGASEMDVLAADSTGGTVQVKDSLSEVVSTSLAIAGTMASPTPGPATVLVDSLGALSVQGPLRIWGGGGKLAVSDSGSANVDSALCSGEVQLTHGTIREELGTSVFHLVSGGFMHGVGIAQTAVSLDDTTARLETLASDPPGVLTVGDSLRTDAFRSQGTVRIESDTLAILAKGGPYLGHVVLAGGTLSLPGGGHLRAGDVLEGTGKLEGNLTDDGLVNASGEIDVPGHLTVMAGDIGGTGLTVPAGGELSARGHVSGQVNLAGQFDMGTSLAKLTMTRTPMLQAANLLTMRIGSAAHGAQDTLVINQAMTLAGNLDLRTWKPDPSLPGDTLTLISAPSVTGTFSKVTIDGVDAPSYVQVIYEPARVRVAVLQSTVDVPPPSPGHTNLIALRFAASGSLRSPAFALDLPRPSTVVLDVYNVAGRRIAELENGKLDAGRYRFPFQGAPGVYYAQASITDQAGRRALTAHVVQLP